jgi:type II secretory pathway pseudopilin PulG
MMKPPKDRFTQQGYTLAGALVMIAVLSVFMALSVPLWSRVKQRENEEELIFRGREYMEAVARYHQKFNSFPPDIETLYKQKFLRKLYKDPMTESGTWKVLRPDSLVNVGEAGKVNRPGEGGSLATPDKDDDDQQKRADKKKQTSDPDEQQEESFEEGENLEAEEPEEEESETLGPIVGVVSRSNKTSIKVYNGQTRYSKWVFAYAPQQQEQQKPDGEKPDQKPKPKKPGQKPKPNTPSQNNPPQQDEDDNN